ncbi:phage baseplate protein [Anaerosolibacter sp.]|uniref:phage baseplate protein n=1 Tax=Anaerosolibacter sp. TaxID=1872527 RepID=UPI0039F03BA4
MAQITDGRTTVVFSTVESENPNRSSEVTSNPVETGEDVADHVKSNPTRFPITGLIVGPDAAQKLSQIDSFRRSGAILTYIGRNLIQNVVIKSFNSTHDSDVANGFRFSIELEQVRIAVKKTVNIILPGSVPPTQVKPVENKGRQQPKKKPADPQTIDRLIATARGKVNNTIA